MYEEMSIVNCNYRQSIGVTTSQTGQHDILMQLANLECERHNIDKQIERLRKLAKIQAQMNNQGN